MVDEVRTIDVVQDRPERLPGESELDFSARMGRLQAKQLQEDAAERDRKAAVDAAAKARAVWGS